MAEIVKTQKGAVARFCPIGQRAGFVAGHVRAKAATKYHAGLSALLLAIGELACAAIIIGPRECLVGVAHMVAHLSVMWSLIWSVMAWLRRARIIVKIGL